MPFKLVVVLTAPPEIASIATEVQVATGCKVPNLPAHVTIKAPFTVQELSRNLPVHLVTFLRNQRPVTISHPFPISPPIPKNGKDIILGMRAVGNELDQAHAWTIGAVSLETLPGTYEGPNYASHLTVSNGEMTVYEARAIYNARCNRTWPDWVAYWATVFMKENDTAYSPVLLCPFGHMEEWPKSAQRTYAEAFALANREHNPFRPHLIPPVV